MSEPRKQISASVGRLSHFEAHGSRLFEGRSLHVKVQGPPSEAFFCLFPGWEPVDDIIEEDPNSMVGSAIRIQP